MKYRIDKYNSEVAFEIKKEDVAKLFASTKNIKNNVLKNDLTNLLASAERIEFEETTVFHFQKVEWDILFLDPASEYFKEEVKYVDDFIKTVPHKLIRIGEDKEDCEVFGEDFNNISLLQKINVDTKGAITRIEGVSPYKCLRYGKLAQETVCELYKKHYDGFMRFDNDDNSFKYEIYKNLLNSAEKIIFDNTVVLIFKNVKWQSPAGKTFERWLKLYPHEFIQINPNANVRYSFDEEFDKKTELNHLSLVREIQINSL